MLIKNNLRHLSWDIIEILYIYECCNHLKKKKKSLIMNHDVWVSRFNGKNFFICDSLLKQNKDLFLKRTVMGDEKDDYLQQCDVENILGVDRPLLTPLKASWSFVSGGIGKALCITTFWQIWHWIQISTDQSWTV